MEAEAIVPLNHKYASQLFSIKPTPAKKTSIVSPQIASPGKGAVLFRLSFRDILCNIAFNVIVDRVIFRFVNSL